MAFDEVEFPAWRGEPSSVVVDELVSLGADTEVDRSIMVTQQGKPFGA